MSQTLYDHHGQVAVITLDNPPVNGLGHALRSGIIEGLDQANADDAIRAVVLIGAGKAFSGGADIREFNTPLAAAEPRLNTVIEAIEHSSKPVVAAIHAVAMGGGLELALGCHYRVALRDAQIALPEVKLGLLPGAGGTQRLPRLVGVETALNMIVSGTVLRAGQLQGTALFDQIIEGDLRAGALAFALDIAGRRPLPLVRERKIDYPQQEAYFQFARNSVGAVAKKFPAPVKCVDAVANAVSKSFDEGLRLEREYFATLVQSPESRALRHAFFGERAASKIDDVSSDTPIRPINSVAVIGAGTMGGGITMNFLNSGMPVVLLETNQEALERGVATIRRNYLNTMKKGRLTQVQLDARMALLKPTLDYGDIDGTDLAIEAVIEEMGVKEQVFKQLARVMKPGAILASNTSTLDVDHIAQFTNRPQDVLGLHFFSPANVMRLLEVVRGKHTAKDVLATVMQLAKKIGKTAVVSGVCDGFIGNRMIKYYGREANLLVEEGATPQQVDRVIENFGLAMGPFRMADLAGNDIGWAIRKRLYAENPSQRRMAIPDRLCELGRYGQKAGKGWYRYEPSRRDALPDTEVERVISDCRKAAGITPRRIADDEIVERCIYALVNEGARILEEGIAARASDIDMVYLTGYGFPAHRGGPMLYADEVGLYKVVRTMRRFAAERDDLFWRPASLLERLAAEGRSLT